MGMINRRVHQASDNTRGLSGNVKKNKARILRETAQFEKDQAKKLKSREN